MNLCEKGHVKIPYFGSACKKCRLEYVSSYNKEKKAHRAKLARERYRIIREETLKAYGGKCQKCHEKEQSFLAVDHINNDGNVHRALFRKTTSNVHVWLKKHDYPNIVQLLCNNCNLKKEIELRKQKNSKSWDRNRKIKVKVIKKYGGICACCGESDIDKLTIDHVNGGGSNLKRSYPSNSNYHYLRDKPINEEFQVMCANCNQSKHTHGVCIHNYLSSSSSVSS